MLWQDVVILISQLVFAFALFPSILSKDKPAFATSILNTVFLLLLSYTNFTLGLFGAAFGLFLVGILWGILAVQKYIIDKKH